MVFIGCILGSSLAMADSWESLFPDAQILYESERDHASYSLPLGSFKKVDSRWHPEREQQLRGTLQRLTFEISDRLSFDQVHRQLRTALLRRNGRPLFTCSGLDCGSSNTWANTHFEIKQLYGLDQNQYYGAWELQPESGKIYYLSTYVVQRGNKRIYAQIDQIEVPNSERENIIATPATLVETLQQSNYFVLAGVHWSEGDVVVDKDHLQALVSALELEPWLKIHIVGHDYRDGGSAQQQVRSKKAAEQVRDQLIKAGIDSKRLSAHGLGGLSPAGRHSAARIEIVRQ